MVSIYKTGKKLDNDVVPAFPGQIIERDWKSGIFRRSLGIGGLVVVSLATILIWVIVCSCFCGFQVINARGVSMEPSLKNGDALWSKQSDISTVKIGDIVTLGYREGSITHRVVEIEPVSGGIYHVVTRGDANSFTEGWNIDRYSTVPVMIGRFPLGGFVLEFVSGFPCKVLLISLAAIFLSVILFRKRGYGKTD